MKLIREINEEPENPGQKWHTWKVRTREYLQEQQRMIFHNLYGAKRGYRDQIYKAQMEYAKHP